MNWPRGKYNGQKIVGIESAVRFRITGWREWGARWWLPKITTWTGDLIIIWAFWNVRFTWEYQEAKR